MLQVGTADKCHGKIAASFHLRALAKTLRVALGWNAGPAWGNGKPLYRYTCWNDGTWTFAEWWMILYDMFSVAKLSILDITSVDL